MHIIANSDGTYTLLDSKNKDISSFIYPENSTNSFTQEELLVSTVISVIPEKIIIHNGDNITNQEMLTTLKKIFVGKIKNCSGCMLCNNIKH